SAGLPVSAFLRFTSASARWVESAAAFGVVFLRHRITEKRHQTVAQFLGDVAAHFCHRCGGGIQIQADQIAPVFSIQRRRDAGRTYKITEHHCDMSAFAGGFYDRRPSWRRSRWSCGRCRERRGLHARAAAQSSDGVQELHTVTKRGDTKLLQVLVRQARENRFVYVILAEDRLVLPEA